MAENPANSPTQTLLEKAFPSPRALSIFSEKLHYKPLFLHATPTTAREIRRQERLRKKEQFQKRPNRKPKPLTAREKRALRVHEIPREAKKYALYESLHELWVGYMQEALRINPEMSGGGGVGMGQAQIGLRLASADYHGAMFEVVRSRCPSRVGINGICVKETKGMFYIITQSNKIKEVPKEHTVFRFTLPAERLTSGGDSVPDAKDGASEPTGDVAVGIRSMVFELHGSQFMYRAAERAGRKFKQKPVMDL